MTNKPCIMCHQTKEAKDFSWYAYTTNQGKKSIRRESRCKSCNQLRSQRRTTEQNSAVAKRWRQKHPGAVKAYRDAYSASPHGKAIRKKHIIKRDLGLAQRTPTWADIDAMAKVYERAAQLTLITGVLHEVDHVLPLRGKTVSGLHVAENLQALPANINRHKHNSAHV